jgi:hypothetical protein
MRSWIILIFCLLPSASFAGAWAQPQGDVLVIQQAEYYISSQFWDENGDTQKAKPYIKRGGGVYTEYGFLEGLTLGGHLTWFDVNTGAIVDPARQVSSQGQQQVNIWTADLELFSRYEVYKDEWNVLSLQPKVKLPTYTHDLKGEHIAGKTQAYELMVLAGRGFEGKLFTNCQWSICENQYHYVDAGIGYRYKGASVADHLQEEWRGETTLGIRTSPDWLWLAQTYVAISPRDDNILTTGYAKAQLGLVVNMENGKTIQLGYYRDLWGRNAGQGHGTQISYWYRW